MATQTEFIAWATSPERTLEEAFCAERLVEEGCIQWCRSRRREHMSPKKRLALATRRRLNPAHRATLNKISVVRAAEALASMTCLTLDAHHDRPLRDLSGLRFFPELKALSLHGHEFGDIAVLGTLTSLESLSLSSDELEDLTPLSALSSLKTLHLRLRQPWPVVKGFEALSELETFHWTGNLLPLEGIPRFGKVRIAKFNSGVVNSLPLRDAMRLPEMPWLEELELDGVHRLEGVTRWPRLRNLTLGGPFKDLQPLTGLRGLTHLNLRGDLTRELAPLAQLPELRRLIVRSQHPQDYSVLAEAPRLHEVIAQGCRINRMELSTLHAVLAPWEDEFARTDSRARVPCRFAIGESDALPGNPRTHAQPAARWHEDGQMIASESNWFGGLTAVLGELLGNKKWGRAWTVANGMGWISLHTVEAAEHLPEIVEVTRELLRSTVHPWHVYVAVDLRDAENNEPEPAPGSEDRDGTAIGRDVEDSRDDQERHREKEAYLEREHRMRLIAQSGKQVNPEEFAPPEDTRIFGPLSGADEDEAGETRIEDLTVPEVIWMHGVITEEGLFADVRGRAAAEHLMGRMAEEAAA